MRRPVAVLVAILLGAIVWFFFQTFRIEGTQALRVVPKSESELNLTGDAGEPEDSPSKFSLRRFAFGSAKKITAQPNASIIADQAVSKVVTREVTSQSTVPQISAQRAPDTLRIASFHLVQFGAKTDNPELALNGVARIIRLFDVLALQGIGTMGEASVIDVARKAGPQYAYLLSKSGTGDQRFAFIYDTNTVVADKGEGLYTLGDPDNLLQRDPLIGWFKAKRPAPEDAFTFTLVNVHTDRRRTMQELNLLDNVLNEVRQDWRDEDDVILMGCFHRSESDLEELGNVRGIVPAIRGVPTTLQGQHQTENMLFRGIETDEFTGRSGVFQFLRAYNLTTEDASQISNFLPIWAEFSIYEGGAQGRVARKKNDAMR